MQCFRNKAKLNLSITLIHNTHQILLKVCYLNKRSLYRYIDDVCNDLNYSSTDVSILSETRPLQNGFWNS